MPDPDATARRLLDLLGTGRSIAPPLAEGLDLAAAYRIAARLRGLREARGERPVGRKIGFTNTTIWPRYGVSAPMWGYVFDTTVTDLPAAEGGLEVAGLAEPRIEPEIVFGIAASPAAGMDDAALLGCIGWVAHGFELVQSVYPAWRFTLPEATAAFALHGALAIGPRHPLGEDRAAWAEALGRFTVSLRRDGAEVEQGSGAFVLGSPLRALGFPRRDARRRSGGRAAARRRDRHHRHPDRRAADPARRALDDRARRHRPSRPRPPHPLGRELINAAA